MLIAIVAVAENLAIGRGGKLPWHYTADLHFFKQKTNGNAVVMGWKTWKSIKKPLPNRLNIVLSRSQMIENYSSVFVLRTREAVLELAKYLNCDVFIIGGASVYQIFKNDIEKWFVTRIPETIPDADVFLPPDFLAGFEQSETEILKNELKVNIYRRILRSSDE